MPQWRSPLLPCSGGKPEANHEYLNIPYSGWYGLFFGTEKRENPTNASQETPLRNEDCCAGFTACIRSSSTRTVTGSDPEEVHWNLPLMGDKEPLTWIHLGKLIFLTEGSSVRILPHKEQSQSNNKTEEDIETPKWCLVYHRNVKKDDPESRPTGTICSDKKTYCCATCTRAFPTVRSVENHFQSTHAATMDPLPLDSIWARPLRIIFEDPFMAVVIKPQGMPVQGDKRTLLRSDLLLPLTANSDPSAASYTLPDGAQDSALRKPRPVHRLDSGTGGLLVLAKTRVAEVKLRQAFAERDCHKKYKALLVGRLVVSASQNGTTDNDDDDDNDGDSTGACDLSVSGQDALTHYRVIRHSRSATSRDGWITIVDLSPHTGRQHQLRKHMKALGYSIWGDRRYGGLIDPTKTRSSSASTTEATSPLEIVPATLTANKDPHSRLCLWAVGITLPHPITGEDMTFSMEDPEWLDFVVKREEVLWKEKHGASSSHSTFDLEAME